MRKIIHKKWLVFLTAVLLVWSMTVQGMAALPQAVIPGGMPFGVKFACEGLIVVGFTEVITENGTCMPAYEAGIRVNDRIFAVNHEPVKTTEEFINRIALSGEQVIIEYERNGENCTAQFTPAYNPEEGKYKTGMWIRDTTAGIGTVTFILPETGAFAGLGHGICDQATGALLPMARGTVVDVTISGVTKGASGRPGELQGYFTDEQCGVLLGNTLSGVYGLFTEIPGAEETVALGTAKELHEGDAYIWCTLDNNIREKYKIKITKTVTETGGNFEIAVTDPALMKQTGGIVQGMSGSPILQDGKLVGAVTHVLIRDPTRGYGISIEKMFSEMPELLV